MGKDLRTEIPVCRSLLASRAMHVFSSESQRSEITKVDVSVEAQSVVVVRSAFRQHAATEVGVLVRWGLVLSLGSVHTAAGLAQGCVSGFAAARANNGVRR
jgi:hypothetical protein